jgi:hypothetical protein
VVESARSQLPDYKSGFSFQIGPHDHGTFQTFVWDGFDWTASLIVPRLLWFAIAALTVLLAALFFDRFDPSRGIFHRVASGVRLRGGPASDAARGELQALEEVPASASSAAPVHLTPLAESRGGWRFGTVFAAELRLMLKGRSRWWYLVALGLLIGSFSAPAGEPRGKVLAFAWLWPVLVWSAMGTRESRYAMGSLVFSSARALERQLPAAWLAGVAVCWITGAGVAIRSVFAGDWVHLLGWVVGSMFIPAMALALGVWGGTSKLFEGLYTAFWYAGPVQPTPALDFMGASPVFSARIPLYYLAATFVLLAAAVVGRRRQIRR